MLYVCVIETARGGYTDISSGQLQSFSFGSCAVKDCVASVTAKHHTRKRNFSKGFFLLTVWCVVLINLLVSIILVCGFIGGSNIWRVPCSGLRL